MYPIWHKDKKQFKWAVLISRDPTNVPGERPDSNGNGVVVEKSNSARSKAQSPNELLRRISKQQSNGLGADRAELLNIRNKIIRIRLRRSSVHASKSPTARVDVDRLLEPIVVRFKVRWHCSGDQNNEQRFMPCNTWQGEKGTQVVTLGDFWVCSQQDLFLAALREHRFDAEKALAMVRITYLPCTLAALNTTQNAQVASRVLEAQQKCWSTEQQREFIRHFQKCVHRSCLHHLQLV